MINGTTINTNIRHVEVLLVEDNPGDIALAKKALSNSKLINNLNIVVDGEEAIAYLYKKGQYKNTSRPDLILLDLNLPKKSGQEVLAEIKSDEDLKRIPVVILTTLREREDVLKSYNGHANCYITKPVDLSKFQEVVSSIENFWFSIVILPAC